MDLMALDEQRVNQQQKPRILIVEDEVMMSDLLSGILSPHYATTVAETVESAFEHSYQNLPDLILCDIKLPDGSGLKILKTLKENELTAHIPILMISCLADEEDIIMGLELGADDYISKPFSNSELLVRVKTQLLNRQRIIKWCKDNLIDDTVINSDLLSKEQIFLEKLKTVSEKLIQDGELTIDALAREMAHSKRQLQRKVKEHLNYSCSGYIFGLRMNYADILNKKGYSTKEITSMVGYKDVGHFSLIFKKYLEKQADVCNGS